METTTGESRMRVLLQQRSDGSWEVVVRLEAWDASLGWYPQKTLVLEPDQIAGLRRQLAAADRQLRLISTAQSGDSAEAEIIPFPQVERTS